MSTFMSWNRNGYPANEPWNLLFLQNLASNLNRVWKIPTLRAGEKPKSEGALMEVVGEGGRAQSRRWAFFNDLSRIVPQPRKQTILVKMK